MASTCARAFTGSAPRPSKTSATRFFCFDLRVKRRAEGPGGDLGVARRGALQLERADLPRPRASPRPRRRARRRLAGHRLPSIGFASGN